MRTRTDIVLEQYHQRAQDGGEFTKLERDLYECVVRNLVELVQCEENCANMTDEVVRLQRRLLEVAK